MLKVTIKHARSITTVEPSKEYLKTLFSQMSTNTNWKYDRNNALFSNTEPLCTNTGKGEDKLFENNYLCYWSKVTWKTPQGGKKKDRENNKTQTQQIQFVNTSINRQIPYLKIVSAGWKGNQLSLSPKCYIKTYRQIEFGDGNSLFLLGFTFHCWQISWLYFA